MKSSQKHPAKKSKEGKSEMLADVIQIIKDTFSPDIDVTGETAIKNDLRLDSFEILNLIFILENRYKITIDDAEVSSLVTVNDICDYLDNK